MGRWKLDVHGNREMIGTPAIDDAGSGDVEILPDQNVIQHFSRSPTGESFQISDRASQAGTAGQSAILVGIRLAVQIPHQDEKRCISQQIGQKFDLPQSGSLAQGQMSTADRYIDLADPEASNDCSASRQSRQFMVMDRNGTKTAQKAVAMQRQTSEPAVDLIVPVREVGMLSQILGLYDLVAPYATPIDLLQTYDVEWPECLGNSCQIRQASAGGQHMTPTTRDIFVVTRRTKPGLNVEAGQLQSVSVECRIAPVLTKAQSVLIVHPPAQPAVQPGVTCPHFPA